MRKYGLDHTYSEHVADGVVHVLGVTAALIGATTLLIWAAMAAPADRLLPLLVYSVGLIGTFSLSAAYNMTVHEHARKILRRFDHAAIFVMIAGTYTPVALIGIGGASGIALTAAAWSIAVLGMVLKLFFFHRFYRAVFALYLIQGWLAVAAILPMVQTLSAAVLTLIAAGGIIYSLGTIVHHRENWAYNRAIWHVLVLAAASLHYGAVFALASSD